MKEFMARQFEKLMMRIGYVPMHFAPRKGWMWLPTAPNHVLRGEDFVISYIPINRDASLPKEKRTGTKEKSETAICWGDIEEEPGAFANYLVLNGDHREAYEERIGDLSECIDYYSANKEEYNSWYSTDNQREREEAKK